MPQIVLPISKLRAGRKHLLDTIKLVAYRAKRLSSASCAKPSNAATTLVRNVLKTPVNLRSDIQDGVLRNPTPQASGNPIDHAALGALCEELNPTETKYRGTDLPLKYRLLRASQFQRLQDV